MGCYAGSPESLKPSDSANARGYWERWDAWALDEQILAAAGANWQEVADLDLGSLDEDERRRFEAHARELVAELDERRPWVLKDPRLCLVLPLWRPALSAPVFVLAYRDPLEVARSLQARDGLPLAVGIALWEVYNLAALRHSLGAPRLCVSYNRLLSDPRDTAAALAAGLAPFAPGALVTPNADELAEVVASDLHHQCTCPHELDEHLNASQSALLRALEEGTALEWEVMPPPSAGALAALRSFTAAERERLALSRRAAELARRCAEAEGDAAWRRDREVGHERWIASLREALAAAEAELERLRQRDADISSWNDTLTARLAAAESDSSRLAAAQLEEVAGLTAQLDELRQTIGRLESESQVRQREAETLRRRLDEVRRVLGATARHAERSRLQADELDRLVAEILRSRSWRVGRSLTAPARWGRQATPAESHHGRMRREAESLAVAQRSLAEQAARWIAEEEPREAAPESED